MKFKRGQVAIFIIVAIVLVVSAILFFVLKDSVGEIQIPAGIDPFYTSFLNCIEEDTLIAIDIIESQGGYIFLPEYESGSSYMPFSSELNFAGTSIPYWYYLSGNNIQKEQIPSLRNMEKEIQNFIEQKITECNLENFYEGGVEVVYGEPSASVSIDDEDVSVSLNMNLVINRFNESVILDNHEVSVSSKLGELYEAAVKVYDYEQDTLFLENYAVDTLRTYAPVDGVELTCSPLIWEANEVFDNLTEAIEANTLALKTVDGDYSLTKEENRYFIVDVSTDSNVRFMNSRNWPNFFEVYPGDSNVLMAEPVGNQQGLGILGFCYVPYHFVYNLGYPVLVQIEKSGEVFQFPVVVIVRGNKPREALITSFAGEVGVPELCSDKNVLVEVSVYDNDLNLIEADISYECFGDVCELGRSNSNEPVIKGFPQCVNGYAIAKAEGFRTKKELFSNINETHVEILLDKLYELDIDLKIDGKDYNKNAIISFVSEDSFETIVYPEQKSIKLSEGQYEVQVYVYRNSSLTLEKTSNRQCVDVPQSGVGGLFGLTKEKCFDVEIPAQVISNALSGGGKQKHYILESDLIDSETIEIYADSLPRPTSIEKLQDNYLLFEEKKLDIMFK